VLIYIYEDEHFESSIGFKRLKGVNSVLHGESTNSDKSFAFRSI